MIHHDWQHRKVHVPSDWDGPTTFKWECSRCHLDFPTIDVMPRDDGRRIAVLLDGRWVRTACLADCDEEKAREIHDS